MSKLSNIGVLAWSVFSFTASAQTYVSDFVDGPITDRPVRILQTNSAGDDVYVFDPSTMQQVGYIENLPHLIFDRSHYFLDYNLSLLFCHTFEL